MAINKTKINQAYSVDKPLQSLAQEVIVANRAPVSDKQPNGDRATIGQIWCDKKNLNAYILTGYSTDPATKGQSVWTQIDNSGGSGSFTSITVSGDSNLNGPIKLPYSTAGGNGVIYVNNTRFIHDFGTNNNSVFFGLDAGNLTNTAERNIGIGSDAGKSITSGNDNIALGVSAGTSVTSGSSNTLIGGSSGSNSTTGANNTLVGYKSGNSIVSNNDNTVVGAYAAESLAAGGANVFIGIQAGRFTSGGNNGVFVGASAGAGSGIKGDNNVAVGYNSLGAANFTGGNNICIGRESGINYNTNETANICIGYGVGTAGESNTIRIGNPGSLSTQQDKAFIAGIRGVTTAVADAIPVLIDSAHQLGTVSSSARYKENIVDLADQSSIIYDLKPKAFNLKAHPEVPAWGLIAEEVDKVFPQLCVYKDDQPETVKYHELPVLLLNELQKLKREVEELKAKLT